MLKSKAIGCELSSHRKQDKRTGDLGGDGVCHRAPQRIVRRPLAFVIRQPVRSVTKPAFNLPGWMAWTQIVAVTPSVPRSLAVL